MHVLHVTSKDEAIFLAGHKDVATAEATPPHLTLARAGCYQAPRHAAPSLIRRSGTPRHRAGLWSGIAQGVIDNIGSDHSPHTREERRTLSEDAFRHDRRAVIGSGYARSRPRRSAVPCNVSSISPAPVPPRVFGIASKGRIAAGYDADLTVVDLKRRETITDAWTASRGRLDALQRHDRDRLAGWNRDPRAKSNVGRQLERGLSGVNA